MQCRTGLGDEEVPFFGDIEASCRAVNQGGLQRSFQARYRPEEACRAGAQHCRRR
nr:hypothetical protein [Halomonas zhangzhouensis]